MRYVDGHVLLVPKTHVQAYHRIAPYLKGMEAGSTRSLERLAVFVANN